jgi:hypothetical protein
MFDMKKRLLHRFMPFVELPPRQRRDLYVSLRWRISRKASIYGGKFTSDLVLDEPDRPKLYKQWFDFYFLGSDGITIWNAFIEQLHYAWVKTARAVVFSCCLKLAYKWPRATSLNIRMPWLGLSQSKTVPKLVNGSNACCRGGHPANG